jgi:hyperosmotically inducible protein
MKTVQLFQGACVVALGVTVGGCNRSGTTDPQQVRDEARQAAAKAGEQLADGWLMTKVQAQFFADSDVHARNIAVTARDGVVTLKGRVPDENAHTQATQIARNTDGVRDVVDQLVVGPEEKAASRAPTPQAPPAPPSEAVATTGNSLPDVASRGLTLFDDARITSAIQSKYFLDDTVKGRHIDVDTSTGVVTLRGEVGSDAERTQALQLARDTDGVQRVEDALTVNPQATSTPAVAPSVSADDEITTKIQAQFFLDPDVKVNPMKVTTSNGIVTLEGEVRSQAAKDRAIEVARQTDGVMQVIDRLQVQRVNGGRPAPARRK